MKQKLTEKHEYLKEDIVEIIVKYFGEIANDDAQKNIGRDIISELRDDYEFFNTKVSSKTDNESQITVSVYIQETKDSEYVELMFIYKKGEI